jgi:hypothetical protein
MFDLSTALATPPYALRAVGIPLPGEPAQLLIELPNQVSNLFG